MNRDGIKFSFWSLIMKPFIKYFLEIYKIDQTVLTRAYLSHFYGNYLFLNVFFIHFGGLLF